MSWGSLQRGTVPLGVHSGPKSLVQLPSLLGLGIRDSGAALPPPVGGTIALSSQSRYPWTTRTGERCWESKEIPAWWPPFLQGAVRQVPHSAHPTPARLAATSMRSASRRLQIPGVRGARPAPPATRARAPACGSPAPAVRL